MSKLHDFKNAELTTNEQTNSQGQWGGWGGYSYAAPAIHIPSFSFSLPKFSAPAKPVHHTSTQVIQGQPGQPGKSSFGKSGSSFSGGFGKFSGGFGKLGGLFSKFGGGYSSKKSHGWW